MATIGAEGPRVRSARWSELSVPARIELLRRPNPDHQSGLGALVRGIIEEVREGGDVAVVALTERFDGIRVEVPEVGGAEFGEASRLVPAEVKAAMAEARERLIAWHRAGMAKEFQIDTAPGVSCGRVLRGIRRVGLYVPSGSAPLPSTALMLGVPASLAQSAGDICVTTRYFPLPRG